MRSRAEVYVMINPFKLTWMPPATHTRMHHVHCSAFNRRGLGGGCCLRDKGMEQRKGSNGEGRGGQGSEAETWFVNELKNTDNRSSFHPCCGLCFSSEPPTPTPHPPSYHFSLCLLLPNAVSMVRALMKWYLMSSDVSWHIRDKLWPMLKHGSI